MSKKTKTLQISVTPEEFAGARLEAEAAGITVSVMLRQKLAQFFIEWNRMGGGTSTSRAVSGVERSYKSDWD